ncbi:AAA family ATPase [Exiguobacterium sp. ERU656]|uniref:AAA family ATPase n=1 Tax=Exiguobacterium sp. ERU656 TaxID=2751217 RepID=UPI001BE85E45|nr:AAA family ATPase [Exiguobacterium sp. ERU656]
MRIYEFSQENALKSNWVVKNLEKIRKVKVHPFSNITREEINYINELNKKNIKLFINDSSLKEIKIYGLFGIHNFYYNFESSVNIFIAENGFGKTTILNIIVAALNKNIFKLHSLPFEKVEIVYKNIKKDRFIYDKSSDLNNSHSLESIHQINTLSRLIDNVRVRAPRKYKTSIDGVLNIESKKINYPMLIKYLGEMKKIEHRNLLNKHINNLETFLMEISGSNHLDTPENILYFPTYRRVESELTDILNEDLELKSLNEIDFSKNIQFGLNDVQNLLDNLSQKLKDDAINLYSQMNGAILDTLLRDEIKKIISPNKQRINIKDLKVIIGRIGENKIRETKKLYNFIEKKHQMVNENITLTESQIFLDYYLNKLLDIYEMQKPIENRIIDFVNVCNKYLVNKSFFYDPVLTLVNVKNEVGDIIELSMLSSGEKQLISIFAQVYLLPREKFIFIIDEPELSLSLKWQRQFLVDVYESNNISLLISTTHSPFIFDNIFQNYTFEMKYEKENKINE